MRDEAPWLLAIALALSVAALVYVAAALRPDAAEALSAPVEPMHWRDEQPLSGVVLRRERLLPARAAVTALLVPDGRRLAAGEAFGVSAATGEEFFRGRLLLRLNAVLAAAEAGERPPSEDALAREGARLRSAAARRDFDTAAETAECLAERLFPDEARILALRREAELLTAAGAADAVLTAPESGFFVRSTDGWEGLETVPGPEAIAVMRRRGAEPTTAVGRLVTGSEWRLAAVVGSEAAARFSVGDVVRLELAGAAVEAELTACLPAGGEREELVFSALAALCRVHGGPRGVRRLSGALRRGAGGGRGNGDLPARGPVCPPRARAPARPGARRRPCRE